MPKFNKYDRVKVLDKPNWPDGGYKIAHWEGTIIEIVKDPAGYVVMQADKTGYKMLFHEQELEPLPVGTAYEPTTDHDGASGLIDTLRQKTKGKSSVDVRLDL